MAGGGWAREALRLGPHAGAHRVAGRAAVSLGVPLTVLVAIGRTDLALYATFAAFAALYGRFDRHVDRLRMQAAAGAALLVSMAAGTLLAAADASAPVAAVAVAVVGGGYAFVAGVFRWHPSGALFGVFGAGATAGVPIAAVPVGEALLTAVATLLVTVLVGAAGVLSRTSRARERAAPVARPPIGDALLVTAVIAVAGLLAGLWSDHWYWAQVAAVAALGGATLPARLTRAVQRLVGTAVGVLVAGALLALDPAPWAIVAAAIVLQGAAQLLVGRNYGLTVLCITPLALLMVHLAAPVPAGVLVIDRLLDTVAGVAVAVAAALVAARIGRGRADRRGMIGAS